MKITDKMIDQWLLVLNTHSNMPTTLNFSELIEILRGLKVDRLVHLQQIANFESQVALLTANQRKQME
jgi:hypothetical protein